MRLRLVLVSALLGFSALAADRPEWDNVAIL